MLTPPRLLILRGDLGAGKTTLVKGIADALDAAAPDEVTSPTFTLIHEYEGTRPAGEGTTVPVFLYHLDLYRLENERQLDAIGLDELIAPDSIVLVEWGEKFPSVVRRSNGEIVVESGVGDVRRITLTLKN
jgi:tRNA threonylcarbamoyladenosine biosynthesis protein TsaE